MHSTSIDLVADFRDRYLPTLKGCSVLDVGSCVYGKQVSYRDLFTDYKYIGMDLVEGPNVDVVGYDALTPPYAVVISGQTLEHVERPWEFLRTLREYFTKYICIVAPNRTAEHRVPIDTFRYFPDGMRSLFNYAGIEVVEVGRFGKDTRAIGKQVVTEQS